MAIARHVRGTGRALWCTATVRGMAATGATVHRTTVHPGPPAIRHTHGRELDRATTALPMGAGRRSSRSSRAPQTTVRRRTGLPADPRAPAGRRQPDPRRQPDRSRPSRRRRTGRLHDPRRRTGRRQGKIGPKAALKISRHGRGETINGIRDKAPPGLRRGRLRPRGHNAIHSGVGDRLPHVFVIVNDDAQVDTVYGDNFAIDADLPLKLTWL